MDLFDFSFLFYVIDLERLILLFFSPALAEIISKRENDGKREFYVHYIDCKYFYSSVITN